MDKFSGPSSSSSAPPRSPSVTCNGNHIEKLVSSFAQSQRGGGHKSGEMSPGSNPNSVTEFTDDLTQRHLVTNGWTCKFEPGLENNNRSQLELGSGSGGGAAEGGGKSLSPPPPTAGPNPSSTKTQIFSGYLGSWKRNRHLSGNFTVSGDTMEGIVQCLVFLKAFSVCTCIMFIHNYSSVRSRRSAVCWSQLRHPYMYGKKGSSQSETYVEKIEWNFQNNNA
jgi:hypothetical protein